MRRTLPCADCFTNLASRGDLGSRSLESNATCGRRDIVFIVLIVEIGIGMPEFVAGQKDKCRSSDGSANSVAVDQISGRLLAAAQESVGCAANSHTMRARRE